jgi:predicted membrane protein
MTGTWADWLVLIVTGAIAWHGLTWREADGQRSWVHLLVGGVAAVFCLRTLLVTILALG